MGSGIRSHLLPQVWPHYGRRHYRPKLGQDTCRQEERHLQRQVSLICSSWLALILSSNRGLFYSLGTLMCRENHLLLMNPDGTRWRLFRKLIHQMWNETRCENDHVKVVNAEAVQMMRDFCVAPEQLMLHPKRYSNSIITSLSKSLLFTSEQQVGAATPLKTHAYSLWNPFRYTLIISHGRVLLHARRASQCPPTRRRTPRQPPTHPQMDAGLPLGQLEITLLPRGKAHGPPLRQTGPARHAATPRLRQPRLLP